MTCFKKALYKNIWFLISESCNVISVHWVPPVFSDSVQQMSLESFPASAIIVTATLSSPQFLMALVLPLVTTFSLPVYLYQSVPAITLPCLLAQPQWQWCLTSTLCLPLNRVKNYWFCNLFFFCKYVSTQCCDKQVPVLSVSHPALWGYKETHTETPVTFLLTADVLVICFGGFF